MTFDVPENRAPAKTLAEGAAHEILNSTTIIGLLARRLLRNSLEGSPEHLTAQETLANLEKISAICKDFCLLSRHDPPSITQFNPNKLIRESIDHLSKNLQVADIRLNADLAEDQTSLEGDIEQIKLAITHILTNAIEAMPGGGTLSISTKKVSAQGKVWWEFRVSDTGPGIPESNLLRIFNPFFSTHKEDGKKGLGLWISDKTIQNHNGKLWSENLPEGGASFISWLPI